LEKKRPSAVREEELKKKFWHQGKKKGEGKGPVRRAKKSGTSAMNRSAYRGKKRARGEKGGKKSLHGEIEKKARRRFPGRGCGEVGGNRNAREGKRETGDALVTIRGG